MNPLVAHFQMMARYNRIANQRLYDCCTQLSDAERKKNRQAFFKSIHGTLNHIMVGDRNWMTRFEGGVASSAHLDAILYEDFDELRAARIREDERIERFAAGLSETFLDGEIAYDGELREGFEFYGLLKIVNQRGASHASAPVDQHGARAADFLKAIRVVGDGRCGLPLAGDGVGGDLHERGDHIHARMPGEFELFQIRLGRGSVLALDLDQDRFVSH